MIRLGAQRALLRPLAHNRPAPSQVSQQLARFTSKAVNKPNPPGLTKTLALTAYHNKTSLVRHYASATTGSTRQEKEDEYRHMTLHAHPEAVNSGSSMHPVFGEVGQEAKEEDTDMMAGVKHDMKVIKDTFALDNVPKEALNIGMAGVLPYLATSAATVYCAFEMNHAAKTGAGWLLSEATAEGFLHILEPLQVGYGAVILSFLGAIHWGLEWAKYGGTGGYPRYMIGVATTAVAWPTILLPVEYALITQFLAFNLSYALDSVATTRGWTPPWYGAYRFMLTFVVGASIVVSLIGRGQIQDRIGKLPKATDHFKELQIHGSSNSKKRAGEAEEDDD